MNNNQVEHIKALQKYSYEFMKSILEAESLTPSEIAILRKAHIRLVYVSFLRKLETIFNYLFPFIVIVYMTFLAYAVWRLVVK